MSLEHAFMVTHTGPPCLCQGVGSAVWRVHRQVLTWCPKDSLVRNLLGALKAKAEPVNLQVFNTRVEPDGTVLVQLAPKKV